ncbi:MAG: sulfatase-like hydrolase/transferase, partial [Spirochaetia bacterium]|nr:sulfatase-like hydrolase/transferase [Spirochaetia bacterium]
VGKIIDKVESLGLRESTLVFFTGDNGMNMGHHGIWGKGNGTFPMNMFDTSVKVLAIISRPGSVPEGMVSDAMLSHYDVLPTLLGYLGIPLPESASLPGQSFAAILEGKPVEEREDVVVFDEYGPVRMIRTKMWKLVHRYPYGPHELYNLEEDPEEKSNLIDDPLWRTERARLKSRLDEWFRRYEDPGIDGVREAVAGKGQFRPVGARANGEAGFVSG